MFDFFISYSRFDSDVAEKIVDELERRGATVWIDKNGIESGDEFKRVIVAAIQNSGCVIFLSSQFSNKSPWTAKEIGVATYERKKIIPIRLDDSKYNNDIIFDLVNLDYIDFNRGKDYSTIIDRVIGRSKKPVDKPKQSYIKSLYSTLKYNNSKRNVITNISLYAILIISLLAVACLLGGTIWSLSLLSDPEWSFGKIYGKGFLPGIIICCVSILGCIELLQWKRVGFYRLIICYILALFPLIFNEFEELLWFSIPIILGLTILFVILSLKKDSKSTWSQCIKESKTVKKITYITITIWLLVITIIPPGIALIYGFRTNLYSKGMLCIDARLNDSAFYCIELYREILFDDNFSGEEWRQRSMAKSWVNFAIQNKTVKDYLKDDISEEAIAIDNLVYMVKHNDEASANDAIDAMAEDLISKCLGRINEQRWMYYDSDPRYNPYIERVQILLNNSLQND